MSEIATSDLPKKVTKILTGDVAKYIDYYKSSRGCPPESVHLDAKSYDALEKALKEKKRKLSGGTYHGVSLQRAAK